MSSMSRRMASVVLSQVICIPFVRRPFQDLTRPEVYGMTSAVNLRIPMSLDDNPAGGDSLGAWWMSPTTSEEDVDPGHGINGGIRNEVVEEEGEDESTVCRLTRWLSTRVDSCLRPSNAAEEDEVEKLSCVRELGADDVVILYLHGNAETRSQFHRVELYQIFQQEGFHVLAIDYRGYGDSSKVYPNEETMLEDSLAAYRWLRSICHPETRVIVHGHSLGTGVATRFVAHLNMHSEEIRPTGLILEAPFNRMIDEVRTFKISKLAETVLDLSEVLRDAKCEYDSQVWIKEIRDPILLLHAKGDAIVPYELGLKLYEESKSVCNIEMVSYEEDLQYGHDSIYLDPELGQRVKEFAQKRNPS